jgi:membrane protease YdiL (CAAX protease family)
MTDTQSQSKWRVFHSSAFILLLGCALLIRPLRSWPWIWVAPFAGYFLLVACVRPLRHSLVWLRLGLISSRAVAATLALMVFTSLFLVAFQLMAQPRLEGYRAILPFKFLGGIVSAGILFTIVNATFEEMVFRGILFDGFEAEWGRGLALVVTTALFALGHWQGYPPGPVGVGLATMFGLTVGWLRSWTSGIALPIVAHLSADATIYCILVRSGAV